jgi:DNA-binding GntR family transcriptional regulator
MTANGFTKQAHGLRHRAAHDRDRAVVSGSNFHLSLARLSGNGRAERILVGLFDEVRRLHHLQPRLDSRLSEFQEFEGHLRMSMRSSGANPTRQRT